MTQVGGHESVEWVPRCPNCGAAMEAGARFLGDDMGPKAGGGREGSAAQCPECATSTVITHETGWVSR